MNFVLDASALLAYLHREPGWKEVQPVVGESCICAVNWCEVAQKTKQKGMAVEKARSLLEELGLTIIPFSSEHAELAANLWEQSRQHGLSLADRACLALTIEQKAPVLTTDRVWSELDLGVEIRLLR
jgi:PIN domain nuclease of toxin-antitoxin system